MHADVATSYSQLLASKILQLVMRYRRVPSEQSLCEHGQCEPCSHQHLAKITTSIHRREPVVFILPAFPGKSPNPRKVLGPRPDMAERQSLSFLNGLCRQIEMLYEPGAKIILCSDGRVFNDVVGIADNDITTYQDDLEHILESLGAENLSTFNLDHIFSGRSFNEMRGLLMSGHGETLEAVQADVRSNPDAERMYRGITRFLFEDGLRPDMKISKTALQRECRQRAYQVIQRSRAWDAILAGLFPEAVRLSIHPQVCGSRKIGIHLMETQDEWLTAWHSVAVQVQGRFRLMKRAEVETLGATLIFQDGRPSHYVLDFMPEDLP